VSSDIVAPEHLAHAVLGWNMKVDVGELKVVEELGRGDIYGSSETVMQTRVT
jgi:hypothetical protein